MTTSRPLVLSGPSGVGKGTLIEMLRKAYPGTFSFCVSHTTRAPRPGETDGVSYHFTTKEAMQTQIDHGEFVEWARVHDNMYGTSKSSIRAALERGTPLLDIDVQGARSVHAQPDLNAVFVFVKPPSIEHLKQRLVGRSTESPEAIEKRVRNAVAEIEASNEPFWDRVFVNDNLQECFASLCLFLEAKLGLPPPPKASTTTATTPSHVHVANSEHHHPL